MTVVRRLDHVAVAVRDTEEALRTFCNRLGLRVVHSEELVSPPVRLTYLDCGNAYLQLVQPLDRDAELARWIDEHGEGLHHLCFGVDDALAGASALAPAGAPPPARGSGRGRPSAFVPGDPPHGVRLECTDFSRHEDVDESPGWLPG
ncbi:MAG TPA: VOC family protein [Gaiellaceae bacterium]|nr:VOC family protein [Gaiellaceae bacterium]